MKEDLTQKQVEIMNFIKRCIRHKGYPPSIREIGDGLDIKSTSTVYNNILKLEEKGYLRRDTSKNRAIEVLDSEFSQIDQKETFDIPVIGRVQAGTPILAIENIEDTFPIPIEYSSLGTLFILNVQGESMIDAGILPGDKVIVRQQKTANNGDIVVAMIDESVTVKKFYRHEEHIELRPANSTMCSINVEYCEILGKVVGLYRFF